MNTIISELRAVATAKRAMGFHQPDGDQLLVEERAANTIDELLATLKAIVFSAHPNKSENPVMFQAWQLAHAAIVKAEGNSKITVTLK